MQYFLILILVFLASIVNGEDSFPQILWIYRQQGYQSVPSFTQLTINNKQRYAAQMGWQIKLLSDSNLHQFINIQNLNAKMVEIRSQSSQLKEDIIAIMLLYRYGGMWMDANSIFIREFDWIKQIQANRYIYNKLSPYPQIIIGANTSEEDKDITTNIYYEDQFVNLLPHYQSWFILAKPKSHYLEAVLQALSYYSYGDQLITIDSFFKQVLMQKQKQLDAQNGLFAVMYYNIWHLQADQVIYQYQTYSQFHPYQTWADIIVYDFEDQQPIIDVPYLWKFSKQYHLQFSKYLDKYEQLNCWGADLFIEKGSRLQKYLLRGVENNITRMIDQMQGNQDGYCIDAIGKKYQSQHNEMVNLVVQGGFIGIFLCVFGCIYLFKLMSHYQSTSKKSNKRITNPQYQYQRMIQKLIEDQKQEK